jgi:hypothetical protein
MTQYNYEIQFLSGTQERQQQVGAIPRCVHYRKSYKNVTSKKHETNSYLDSVAPTVAPLCIFCSSGSGVRLAKALCSAAMVGKRWGEVQVHDAANQKMLNCENVLAK